MGYGTVAEIMTPSHAATEFYKRLLTTKLFMLLFAQPISRICRTCRDQVTPHTDNTVTVPFDTAATFDAAVVEMPECL